jgi:hypothetical protein
MIVIGELERMWKEAIVVWNFPEETEGNHEKPPVRISCLRDEIGTHDLPNTKHQC